MRIAVVHDWLVTYGGAERVLEQVLQLYPQADLFSLIDVMPASERRFLAGRKVGTSFLQGFPAPRRFYRAYLPFMPAAIESLDLTGYDLVLSVSFAVAKGVLTAPDQLHISYLQARNLHYAYEERRNYPRGRVRAFLETLALPRIRTWDSIASRRPDITLANSEYVRNWHLHRHGVESHVVYPPVDTEFFERFQRTERDSYFVTVGRLEPVKRVDIIVRAFTRLGLRLLVVGGGSQSQVLRRLAGPTVEFLGYQPREEVAAIVAGARGFVFAAREHFGIAPIEAQACGTPVIAYGSGGVEETVRPLGGPRPTGLFFPLQTAEAVVEVVQQFERVAGEFNPEDCRANARRFAAGRFREEFADQVRQALDRHRGGRSRLNGRSDRRFAEDAND
jgi:glycosyltransferase involved in cell wall biosynthesis